MKELNFESYFENIDNNNFRRFIVTKGRITYYLEKVFERENSQLKRRIESSKANNLETYLTFKVSKHSLRRSGLTLEEIYPIESLQIKNLYYGHIKGNVLLLNEQRINSERQQKRNRKEIVKALLDL